MFYQARDEVKAFDARIHKVCQIGTKDKSIQRLAYWFYWGMVERLLFSWLVDADRLDTAEFEGGSSLTQDWDYDKLWNLFSGKLEDKLHSFALPAGGKARAIALERQKSVMPANTLERRNRVSTPCRYQRGVGKRWPVCALL